MCSLERFDYEVKGCTLFAEPLKDTSAPAKDPDENVSIGCDAS